MKKKSRTGPDISREELQTNPHTVITRRMYYSVIQSLLNPTGFLTPVLLKGKIILRSTWEGDCKGLDWDDPLPDKVRDNIIKFFIVIQP